MSKRPNIFAETDDQDLDLSGFMPRAGRDESAPAVDQLRQVTALAGFPSRQAPAPPAQERQHQRRTYRTARSRTFACRITDEAFDSIYAIADAQGWKVGETIERALKALRRELEEGV